MAFAGEIQDFFLTSDWKGGRLLDRLPSLKQTDLLSLRDPPTEQDNPRVSLHVGWDCVDFLSEATDGSPLRNSAIVRRLLYGLLVDGTVEFVQRGEHWELQVISRGSQEENF